VQVVDPDDGSGRMFIIQQTGQVVILQDDAITGTLLDISGQISTGSEQGLLSIALHPDFAKNGRFYIDYTDGNGNTQVEQWAISKDDPNVADPASATTILSVEQPFPNHNGGLLMFGPDGYLYVGLGDGGSQGDPNGNGQNLGVLLGKILRIDIDQTEGDLPYAIPKDNPFVGRVDARSEIWAYGLRNPWRFSFDRQTGDLYIADVGQGEVEEANFQPAGEGGLNYGWNLMEGTNCYLEADCDQSGLTLPFFEYTHSSGAGCSISGGYVYRGEAIPALSGAYLAGDYCTGYIWAVNPQTGVATDAMESGLSISSFGEDASGELYVVDLNGGIYKIIA
jgi:glucose/arabinose dehydrogenase